MAAGNLSGTAVETDVNCALMLAKKDASTLAALRLAAGVEVAETPDELWIRARQPDTSIQDRLRKLPATERYQWLEGNRLCRVGSLIPCDELPSARWQTIGDWMKVENPRAVASADLPNNDASTTGMTIPIKLVRSTKEVPANALLTTTERWIRFGLAAPEIRLRGLQFAANDSGEALVVGESLPPLPGTQYCIREGIAVPAGFACEPAVEIDVLRRRLGVSADSLVLFYGDGSFSRVRAEQWVAASRSGLRATAEFFERRS